MTNHELILMRIKDIESATGRQEAYIIALQKQVKTARHWWSEFEKDFRLTEQQLKIKTAQVEKLEEALKAANAAKDKAETTIISIRNAGKDGAVISSVITENETLQKEKKQLQEQLTRCLKTIQDLKNRITKTSEVGSDVYSKLSRIEYPVGMCMIHNNPPALEPGWIEEHLDKFPNFIFHESNRSN